jgi:hypothetical protein
MGDTVGAWVKDNTLAVRYVARELFESLLEIAQTKWLEPLADPGALRPEVDRDWAAIHVFVFNLACVLFEPALSKHLPRPFSTDEQLQRWNVATTELHRQALIRPSPPPSGAARRRDAELSRVQRNRPFPE